MNLDALAPHQSIELAQLVKHMVKKLLLAIVVLAALDTPQVLLQQSALHVEMNDTYADEAEVLANHHL